MSKRITFDAMEFQADERFELTAYVYEGSEETGWNIFREDQLYLSLPAGYRLLKTMYCGICSTDIARKDLPFPLPQITGHEIVALDNDEPVVVEINASHHAIGAEADCYYCNNGLANHCPDRLTLGIDRLPGGFAPYILAPKHSIIPLPKNIDPKLAVITEPLAAAIRAVEKTPLQDCQSVAVVGPRRLGSLLLLALDYYRKENSLDYSLTAIVRDAANEQRCLLAGADEVLYSDKLEAETFDCVFDTSGSISGFELSLNIANKYLHLKSTNGQSYRGFNVLTELVINEISIHSIVQSDINQIIQTTDKALIDKCLLEKLEIKSNSIKSLNSEAREIPCATSHKERFKTVVLGDISDLNRLMRPSEGLPVVEPESTIYFLSSGSSRTGNYLQNRLEAKKISLITSRCGDFNKALKLLQKETENIDEFLQNLLTHIWPAMEINEAFEVAKTDKGCVKAVVNHR